MVLLPERRTRGKETSRWCLNAERQLGPLLLLLRVKQGDPAVPLLDMIAGRHGPHEGMSARILPAQLSPHGSPGRQDTRILDGAGQS